VEILWCAAAPQRIEWYLNNTRQRHLMRIEQLSLLPAGTTSNEALHAEINNWFRQTQVRISVDTHALAEPLAETLCNNIVLLDHPLEVYEHINLLEDDLIAPY
jgi:hypothetical protein